MILLTFRSKIHLEKLIVAEKNRTAVMVILFLVLSVKEKYYLLAFTTSLSFV